jgi:hypothetical protein
MAEVPRTPSFPRGSAVLDYWLVHAEGLTVQPLGARVEAVVLSAPVGHAESLIVRSRITRRRTAIPAESIVAVAPSAGQLLLDTPEREPRRLHLPRPSAERVASARSNVARAGSVARVGAAGTARRTGVVTTAAAGWLQPRAASAGAATARRGRFAAAQTARGVVWLTPRAVAAARTAAAVAAQLTLAGAVVVARTAVRTARELERAARIGADRGRASIAARRALRDEARR